MEKKQKRMMFPDGFMIRNSTPADIDRIMEIYDSARSFMRRNGNHDQWINGYPSEDVIIKDIKSGNHYVGVVDTEIVMAFTFIIGDDPTYAVIEGGRWLNDNPYGTVHRIGSSGKCGGMFDRCIAFCSSLIHDIRVDTHRDNSPMLGLLRSRGFTECGIIYTDDGSPRIAFQKSF